MCRDDAEFELVIILMLFANQVVNRFTNVDCLRGGELSRMEVIKFLWLLREPGTTLLSSDLFDVTADVSLSEWAGDRQRV